MRLNRERARILGRAILVLGSCAGGPAAAQGKDLDGVVNLNTAGAETLELLPGIGPAKVRSIVWYRQKHPFRTVDELVRIKGIGRKMVRHLRVHLAISGPTTARATRKPRDPTDAPAPPPASNHAPSNHAPSPPAPSRQMTARGKAAGPPSAMNGTPGAPRRSVPLRASAPVARVKPRTSPGVAHGRRALANHCAGAP